MSRHPALDTAPAASAGERPARTPQSAPERPGSGTRPRRGPASLARLLRLTFGLLITLVLISVCIALIQGFRSSAAVERLTGQILPLQVANSQLLTIQGDAQRGLRNHLNFGQPGFQPLYVQAKAQLPGQMREVERHAADAQEVALARELRTRMETWLGYAEQVDSLTPGTPEAFRSSTRALELYNQFWITSRKLQAHVTIEAKNHQRANDRQRVLSLVSLIGVASVAGVMALAVSLSTYRALAGPLRGMRETLARLTAGEHEARVAPKGPAELHDVGLAINQLADESDRLRDAERERSRMRQVAHETGARIRRSLDVSTVMEEAVRAVAEVLRARQVSLHLIHDDRVGAADVQWRDGELRRNVTSWPSMGAELIAQAYEQHATYNMRTSEIPRGGAAPPSVQHAFEEMPDSALLAVPFGSGADALGALLLLRPWHEGSWSPSEVGAAEVVAADLGYGLHHARLFQQERRLVDELRALDTTKTDFLSTVSHELRSPLTNIVGYLELLRDEEAGRISRHQDQMLNAVERNAVRLQLLIEDLLTLSRIESGAFRSSLQPLDVRDPIDTALSTIQPLADAQGVELETRCSDEALHVRGDPHQLERAVTNLLSNAIKFSPGGGHATLSTRAEENWIEVAVSDTGMGIPEQDQHMMFTRFFRASNAIADAIPGTGLGLSIVRSIVANHAGEMDIRSVEGEGTTVAMRFPRSAPGSEQPNDKGQAVP